MAGFAELQKRFDAYRPSKTALFWTSAGCVVAALIVGFSWGGWVTGATAGNMAQKAVTTARAEMAAAVCVERFARGPDAVAQLASLKGSDSWKRDDFIEKGGWATPPGIDKPVSGAASLCVRQLMAVPPAKTAG